MLAMRLTSLGLIFAGGLLFRQPLRISRPSFRTIALAGTLDMAANVLYVIASHAGALSLVAVVASLYPAGTVALAALVLHERLVRIQWAGVVIAFAGVVCISLGR
jgi:drug/metabolite transporter (DMT)-like permease